MFITILAPEQAYNKYLLFEWISKWMNEWTTNKKNLETIGMANKIINIQINTNNKNLKNQLYGKWD